MDLHAAPIEWVWIVVSAIGVVINATLLRSTIAVQARLRLDGGATHPERIIASANVHTESVRICKQMMICIAGVVSVFLAPPPPTLLEIPQTIITISTLITVSMLISLVSFIERSAQQAVQRETVRNYLRRATDTGVSQSAQGTRATDATPLGRDIEPIVANDVKQSADAPVDANHVDEIKDAIKDAVVVQRNALKNAVAVQRKETAEIANKLHEEASDAAEEFRDLAQGIDKKADQLLNDKQK